MKGRGGVTFLMKATEKVSQETIPWSMSSTKAVSVKDSRSPKLEHNHTTDTANRNAGTQPRQGETANRNVSCCTVMRGWTAKAKKEVGGWGGV